MKIKSLLSVALLFASTVSFAQTVDRTNNKVEVTKGYYSIGKNADKIAVSQPLPADKVVTPVVAKGYYSIEANNNKLSKKAVRLNAASPKPAITKGYYSIGNNAQKLHNQ